MPSTGMGHRGQVVVGALLVVTASLIIVTAGAGMIATAVQCGRWAPPSGFWSGIAAVTGDTSGFETEGGCTPTRGGTIVALVIALLLLLLLAFVAAWLWFRWRESTAYFVRDLLLRRGFARRAELSRTLSSRAARKRAKILRPDLGRSAAATDVAWKVGSSRGMELFVSIEDSVIVVGPPRSGKGFRFIINAILDWPGPLITTSTRNDNLAATLAIRSRVGTATVFDPQKLSGVRTTTKVAPLMGCEDPMTATQRGAALVAGAGHSASGNNAEWAGMSGEILAQLLMAAALDGRDVQTLARWGSSPAQAEEAVEILERSGPPGWGASLSGVLHDDDDKLRGNKWFGVSAAVRPLRIPEIAEAMTVRDGEEQFDPYAFLDGSNTLYLIGTKTGAGAAGGYLAALLDDIVESARRRALSMPNSRLSPPLGLILDEIANIFSWPALPTVMADGGGVGISPLVVLQARSQAETAWSQAEMHSVFSAATARILLGGSTDVPFLRDMQELIGQRDEERRSRSYSESGVSTSVQPERQALMSPVEMRRMPQRLGLLSYRTVRPVLLQLDAWIDRRDAADIKAGKRVTEADQRVVFEEQTSQRRRARGQVSSGGDNP